VDGATKALAENAEKLIHTHGKPAVTVDKQVDTDFSINSVAGTHAKRVVRSVQVYQYETRSHTEKVDTGRRDNDGNREYDEKTIIDKPELTWMEASSAVVQPSVPDHLDQSDFHNTHDADFESSTYHQGKVVLGPFQLTSGMVEGEMDQGTDNIQINLDLVKDFLRSGETIEIEKEEDLEDHKDESSAPVYDETSKLMTSSHHGVGAGSGKSSLFHAPLSRKAKDWFTENAKVSSDGTTVHNGESLSNPVLGDYKISWTAYTLPKNAATNVVETHSVLARQHKIGSGYLLDAWIPEEIEEFHLDSCCAYTCPCGYRFVEDPPKGYGCIACCDSILFPNASNDGTTGEEESVDVEEGRDSFASNSRKVKKCVSGVVDIDSMVHEMEDANAEKTTVYRKIGFLMMLLGFQFMMDPFPKFFGFIPLIGHAIGFILYIAIFFAALAIGCFGSITTISIAWIRYRPLWGILGILVSGSIMTGIIMIKP